MCIANLVLIVVDPTVIALNIEACQHPGPWLGDVAGLEFADRFVDRFEGV